MKHAYTFIVLALATTIAACKEGNADNQPYMEQMKDSIFKAYPTVNSVTVDLKDGNELNVVLGDAHMFTANAATRQHTANSIGMMALRMFPANSALSNGTLYISKDEKSVDVDKSQAAQSVINIDSLRKIMPAK